jgi:hypothetical protein
VNAYALPVNLLKLRVGFDAFMRPERSQCLSGAYGQPFASLRAPPLQHQATVLRAHAHEKTVCFPPPSRVRLERPLPLHIPSLGNEPSMLAFAFGRCQCREVCVKVASLQRRKIPFGALCVWSLPKVFHTCGKNCGNSPNLMGGEDIPKNGARSK